MIFTVFIIILKILGVVVPLLLSVAFFTLAERKIMGSIQRRRGPNVIGTFGLLQAVADGLNPYTGEEFDYEVDEMQSELERLIA